jgi:hypothetical protein
LYWADGAQAEYAEFRLKGVTDSNLDLVFSARYGWL